MLVMLIIGFCIVAMITLMSLLKKTEDIVVSLLLIGELVFLGEVWYMLMTCSLMLGLQLYSKCTCKLWRTGRIG
jgi:hypothetical protein